MDKANGRYYRQEENIIVQANIKNNETGEVIYDLDHLVRPEAEIM